MLPLLFEIGSFPLYTFGLCVALALIAATIRLQISFQKFGIAPELADKVVMAAGISGLLGARIWFILEHWSELNKDLIGALTSNAGFTFYGGFIVATAVVLWIGKRKGIPLLKFVDSMGPSLALGYAIGRLGCQLSGDGDYGIATDSFWGMSYSTGVVPTPPGVLVYPTPLFESAGALLMVWLLTLAEKKSFFTSIPGRCFGLYLILLSIERFLVEFLRPNQKIFLWASEAQCIAVGLIIIGSYLLLRKNTGRAPFNVA